MSAFCTDAVNDILNILDYESFRNMYLGDSFFFEAIGLATDSAGEMHMLAGGMMVLAFAVPAFAILPFVVTVGMFATDAVFLFASAVIECMQQIVFDEERQCTKERALVNCG